MSEKTHAEVQNSRQAALRSALGAFVLTTNRFNLARGGFNEGEVQDILPSEPIDGCERLLVVDESITNDDIYKRLAAFNTPQLPQIGHLDGSAVFGIKRGLKPLANEALFSRQSSDIYISDTEIFRELGRLYRKAFEATGHIILDPDQPIDSPLDHVAIHSFQDGQSFLFLCPPYSPKLTKRENPTDASTRFEDALTQDLVSRETFAWDELDRERNAKLIESAKLGFGEG